MRSIEHVGRGIERSLVKQSNAIEPEKGFSDKTSLIQGNSPAESIEDAHTSYTNNFNVWKKSSLNKIGLAKWISSRNTLPW